ncbi:MAG: hypothetical protein AAFN07_01890 [Pseudomonadota bacterium]
MNSRRFLSCIAALLLLSGNAQSQSEILFEEDFESGGFGGPEPSGWAWRNAPTSASNIETAMMRGANEDVYSVTRTRPYRGSYSMQMDFSGRNNWCNICGSTDVTLTSTTASTGCFSASVDGPYGDDMYNLSNGFSRWRVSSVNGRQICVDTDNPAGDPVFAGAATLRTGDNIKVPRRCGVNGSIGGQPGRRSDCNRAINYLDGISSSDLGYGETISRRFYLFMPSQSVLPEITMKIGYGSWRRSGSGVSNSEFNLSVQRNLQLVVRLPTGNLVVSQSNASRDNWMYFEESWTRESGPGRNDGSYRAYMGRADAPVNQLTTPVVVEQGIEVGELVRLSIAGNWQHNREVSGYVYFDDIVIAKGYVGPIGFDSAASPAEAISDLN